VTGQSVQGDSNLEAHWIFRPMDSWVVPRGLLGETGRKSKKGGKCSEAYMGEVTLSQSHDKEEGKRPQAERKCR